VHFIPMLDEDLDEGLWPDVDKLAAVIREFKTKASLSDLKHITDNAFRLTAEKHTYINRCATILKDFGYEQ
jgi:hypothetical protein